ncbi:ThuA domain-containing protein [Actinomadura rudentiformis]|uniref:ThuA domain-containing protein n=1 Tax=Actinomadura rudentiformis TaxID=359158 RepID=A0A6H9Y772_9ACTN|nr:ThuA domain-containing protein [Actinomadura rudentiformis]KAB2340384.1 ThuA domain-containing protein [Actinomadura rudentiformis]
MAGAGRILAITGGHRVDLDAFGAMMDAVCAERAWTWAHAVQPSAQGWLSPRHADAFDAVVCHDLPGLRLERGRAPEPSGPDPATARAVADLLDQGQGLVMLHHALAGWPGWEGWADALGGRFHYAPGRLRGKDWPSSGTRLTRYTARVAAPDHPVCAGVGDFELDDELYCCPVFASEVVPLLRADADLDPALFVRTYEHVLHGEEAAPDCTGHPPASDLIGWASVAGRSPLVVLQPGDSAATFALPPYRRLLGNAIAWVASKAARRWAAGHPAPVAPSP